MRAKERTNVSLEEYLTILKKAIINPSVIVEVLSKSTESYDRGGKFFAYRQIPSLQE